MEPMLHLQMETLKESVAELWLQGFTEDAVRFSQILDRIVLLLMPEKSIV